MFKSWDELSELEQLQSEYSDLHKDVYGVRARFHYDWSLAELKEAMVRLGEAADEECIQYGIDVLGMKRTLARTYVKNNWNK